jgi:hypothetical protein
VDESGLSERVLAILNFKHLHSKDLIPVKFKYIPHTLIPHCRQYEQFTAREMAEPFHSVFCQKAKKSTKVNCLTRENLDGG